MKLHLLLRKTISHPVKGVYLNRKSTVWTRSPLYPSLQILTGHRYLAVGVKRFPTQKQLCL